MFAAMRLRRVLSWLLAALAGLLAIAAAGIFRFPVRVVSQDMARTDVKTELRTIQYMGYMRGLKPRQGSVESLNPNGARHFPRGARQALMFAFASVGVLLHAGPSSPSEADSARAIIDAAVEVAGKGNLDSALVLLDSAARRDPHNIDALLWKGNYLTRLERYDDAVRTFDEAIKVRRGSARAWSGRGMVLFSLQRYTEMDSSLAMAIRCDPREPTAHFNRGITYLQLGRYAAAQPSFKKTAAIVAATPESLRSSVQDQCLEQSQRYFRWLEIVLAQMKGTKVPPAAWRPNMDAYPTIVRVSSKNSFLIQLSETSSSEAQRSGSMDLATGPGSKFMFEGSEESPYTYLPRFYMWGGAILNDPDKGFLLDEGTHYRAEVVRGDSLVITTGVIRNWRMMPLTASTRPVHGH
jgi:tetratricopeptide (TPR) repeat protein